MPDIWIQVENHPWDSARSGFDRMMGMHLPPDAHGRFMPVHGEALILRRMTPNWANYADVKVNPWDINEPDPTVVGTIPGPTLECNVGEAMTVHFKNMDTRGGWDAANRTHSLHPHGITFHARYDGAYPLSPPDPDQPVGGEAGWTGPFKQSDRVPPLGTFTYHWDTHHWPTTAGVWLYHDHSICDARNVRLGAIGFIVIHNPADPDDVVIADTDTADLPGGTRNGSPIIPGLHLLADKVALGADSLERVGPLIDVRHPPGPDPEPHPMDPMEAGKAEKRTKRSPAAAIDLRHLASRIPVSALGANQVGLAIDKGAIIGFLLPRYRTPPTRAQYLMLLHDLNGVGFCINGRIFLGNTPTVLAGPSTVMRFGVVGMGDMFHTFHLHGHRWTIPGPDGITPSAIQGSAQVTAVSQFEDTRIFGPANSFSFTVRQGSFMGANPDTQPVPNSTAHLPGSIGEWHMHCHVLTHMETGMMGSLLIRQGGEVAGALPHGQPCPPEPTGPTTGATHTINIVDLGAAPFGAFQPSNITIAAGDTVVWHNTSAGQPHTASKDGGGFDTGVLSPGASSAPVPFPAMGTIPYHCNVHPGMHATITVM